MAQGFLGGKKKAEMTFVQPLHELPLLQLPSTNIISNLPRFLFKLDIFVSVLVFKLPRKLPELLIKLENNGVHMFQLPSQLCELLFLVRCQNLVS